MMWKSGELDGALQVPFLAEYNFVAVNTLTGVTGFLINIAVFMQIKVTTPLTNTISGTAKACFQTLLAWAIWRNVISTMVCKKSYRCYHYGGKCRMASVSSCPCLVQGCIRMSDTRK